MTENDHSLPPNAPQQVVEAIRKLDLVKEVLEQAYEFMQRSEEKGSIDLYAYLEGAQDNIHEVREWAQSIIAPLPPPQARTPDVDATLSPETIKALVQRYFTERKMAKYAYRLSAFEQFALWLQQFEDFGVEPVPHAIDGGRESAKSEQNKAGHSANAVYTPSLSNEPPSNKVAESAPQEAPQLVVCHKCGESFIFKRDGNRLLTIVRNHNCGNQAALASQQETLNILARHGIKEAPQEAGALAPSVEDLQLAKALHINYCEDLSGEGQAWEVPAEDEPEYFETLAEAIVFLHELPDKESDNAISQLAQVCNELKDEIKLLRSERGVPLEEMKNNS